MNRLFRRAPATRAGRRSRVALRLESLDCRDNPTADPVLGLGPISAGGPISTTSDQLPGTTNRPPQIVDFAAGSIGDGWWVISGRVIDEHPGGLTVTFGGDVATTYGETTTTDANGNFCLLVCLNANGTDTGLLSAITHDDAGQSSNLAEVYVDP